jgi:hypothetical protein
MQNKSNVVMARGHCPDRAFSNGPPSVADGKVVSFQDVAAQTERQALIDYYCLAWADMQAAAEELGIPMLDPETLAANRDRLPASVAQEPPSKRAKAILRLVADRTKAPISSDDNGQ